MPFLGARCGSIPLIVAGPPPVSVLVPVHPLFQPKLVCTLGWFSRHTVARRRAGQGRVLGEVPTWSRSQWAESWGSLESQCGLWWQTLLDSQQHSIRAPPSVWGGGAEGTPTSGTGWQGVEARVRPEVRISVWSPQALHVFFMLFFAILGNVVVLRAVWHQPICVDSCSTGASPRTPSG